MMISPEAYMSLLQDKNYEEIIKERDNLIDEIKGYEKISDDFIDMNPSREILYKYNHLYFQKYVSYYLKSLLKQGLVIDKKAL